MICQKRIVFCIDFILDCFDALLCISYSKPQTYIIRKISNFPYFNKYLTHKSDFIFGMIALNILRIKLSFDLDNYT
jgi:hypothetical protein